MPVTERWQRRVERLLEAVDGRASDGEVRRRCERWSSGAAVRAELDARAFPRESEDAVRALAEAMSRSGLGDDLCGAHEIVVWSVFRTVSKVVRDELPDAMVDDGALTALSWDLALALHGKVLARGADALARWLARTEDLEGLGRIPFSCFLPAGVELRPLRVAFLRALQRLGVANDRLEATSVARVSTMPARADDPPTAERFTTLELDAPVPRGGHGVPRSFPEIRRFLTDIDALWIQLASALFDSDIDAQAFVDSSKRLLDGHVAKALRAVEVADDDTGLGRLRRAAADGWSGGPTRWLGAGGGALLSAVRQAVERDVEERCAFGRKPGWRADDDDELVPLILLVLGLAAEAPFSAVVTSPTDAGAWAMAVHQVRVWRWTRAMELLLAFAPTLRPDVPRDALAAFLHFLAEPGFPVPRPVSWCPSDRSVVRKTGLRFDFDPARWEMDKPLFRAATRHHPRWNTTAWFTQQWGAAFRWLRAPGASAEIGAQIAAHVGATYYPTRLSEIKAAVDRILTANDVVKRELSYYDAPPSRREWGQIAWLASRVLA